MQLWDQGSDEWFTFPPGTVLQPGARAMVMAGVQTGGSLPTGGPDDLFFDAGRGSAVINNGGDNIVFYDPTNDEFIQATFDGDTLDDPTSGTGYSGFSVTATRNGLGEEFGTPTDGQSLQREGDGADTFVDDTPTPGTSNVCFADGTYLATPDGDVPITELSVGDKILTADRGAQPISWIFSKSWTPGQVASAPNLAAVLIRRGALGTIATPARTFAKGKQASLLVARHFTNARPMIERGL